MKTSNLFKLLHKLLSTNEVTRYGYNKVFDKKDISTIFNEKQYIIELTKDEFLAHPYNYIDTCGYTVICNKDNEMIACFGYDESLSDEFNESGLLYSKIDTMTNEKSFIKFISKTKEDIKIYFYNLFNAKDRDKNPYKSYNMDYHYDRIKRDRYEKIDELVFVKLVEKTLTEISFDETLLDNEKMSNVIADAFTKINSFYIARGITNEFRDINIKTTEYVFEKDNAAYLDLRITYKYNIGNEERFNRFGSSYASTRRFKLKTELTQELVQLKYQIPTLIARTLLQFPSVFSNVFKENSKAVTLSNIHMNFRHVNANNLPILNKAKLCSYS